MSYVTANTINSFRQASSLGETFFSAKKCLVAIAAASVTLCSDRTRIRIKHEDPTIIESDHASQLAIGKSLPDTRQLAQPQEHAAPAVFGKMHIGHHCVVRPRKNVTRFMRRLSCAHVPHHRLTVRITRDQELAIGGKRETADSGFVNEHGQNGEFDYVREFNSTGGRVLLVVTYPRPPGDMRGPTVGRAACELYIYEDEQAGDRSPPTLPSINSVIKR